MIYGLTTAVAVVDRLIKPIQSYLHDHGVQSAICVDDGQVVGRTEMETRAAMQLTVRTYRQAGWNIQWAKTVTEPQREVRYLEVDTDLERFTYSTPQAKIEVAKQLMMELIRTGQEKIPVGCRQVAKMLGKIAAMKTLHGHIVAISTRNTQHHLGLRVVKEGWEAQLRLNKQDTAKIEWFCTKEQRFSGRGIRDVTGPEIIFRRQQVEKRLTAGEEGQEGQRPENQGTAWMVENKELTELQKFPGGMNGTGTGCT
jgi:hypothetical protein